MPRWFQAVRVAGHMTRFELECADWERRFYPHWARVTEDGVEFRYTAWVSHPPTYRFRLT